MELLIPGLILVALMIYASTKIKKKAAAAYKSEMFETAEFSILKPEGFISPINDGSETVFAAYSKDFGTELYENLRRAAAEMRIHHNTGLDEICLPLTENAATIPVDRTEIIGDHRCRIIQSTLIENGLPLDVYYKVIDAGEGGIYELRIAVLPEYGDEYLPRVEEMLDTFKVN